jgi:Ca-activated chloride channel homolog
MKSLRVFCILSLVVLFFTEPAHSIGRVYARIPNSTTSPIYNLRIKNLKATVVIHDQLAVTTVDQEFTNDNTFRLEGFYIFTLPQGARVHEMYLWINGVRTPYTVKKRADAIVIYTDIVRRIADPAILEELGSNTFRLRIFPFEALGTRRIEIQYSQPLTYHRGTINYDFPLDMTDYTSAQIEKASLSIDLQSQLPITSVQTTADQWLTAVQVQRISAYHYTIAYGLENFTFSRDFSVRAAIDRSSHAMIPLTYIPPAYPTEAPYFLLWTSLPDSVNGDSVKTRELTFVADVSSSMDGERLVQLKDALTAFIDALTEQDRFNIIVFSTGVAKFRPDLVPGTAGARDSARTFVSKLTALGLTNIEEALKQSLQLGYKDPIHSAIFFLTDGQPSWGEVSRDSLIIFADRWNTHHTRMYPIAVGQEPDYSLLRELASRSGGTFTSVRVIDSIYVTSRDLYRQVFLPRIRNGAMDFGALGAFDLHPSAIPDLYAGDQLLLAGRSLNTGTAHVRFSGLVGDAPLAIEEDVAFPDTNTSWRAVGRYWGAQKIQSLLDLIAIVGEKPELVTQVVDLSIKYSVLTPYTAFLIVEPTNGGASGTGTPAPTPTSLALHQNFPNPFNPATVIRFDVPASMHVTLAVYNALGQRVALLVDEALTPGTHDVTFDGSALPSGVYYCRLQAGSSTITRVMVLTK